MKEGLMGFMEWWSRGDAPRMRAAKTGEAVAVVEPPSVPAPEIEPSPVLDLELRAQYTALAMALGMTQPALEYDAFAAWCADRGIRFYMRDKVEAFLNRIYGPRRRDEHGDLCASWIWRPLREADQGTAGPSWPSNSGTVFHRGRAYRKPVPYPVLLTVKDLVTVFPTARCFVSDEYLLGEKPQDPFLLVEIADKQEIIERWDEPSYRE